MVLVVVVVVVVVVCCNSGVGSIEVTLVLQGITVVEVVHIKVHIKFIAVP